MKRQTVKTPDGLTMIRQPDQSGCENWDLDVPTLHVWVKRYSERIEPNNPFSGWRVGLGASPGKGYNTFEEALTGVRVIAQSVARWHLDDARDTYEKAVTAARQVGVGEHGEELK
jgi:hypothetical protein